MRLERWRTSYSTSVRSPRVGEWRKRRVTVMADGVGRARGVGEDESGEEGVPGEHEADAAGVVEGGDGPEEAGEQEQERARGETEAQPAAGAAEVTGGDGDRFWDEGLHGFFGVYPLPLPLIQDIHSKGVKFLVCE